VPGIGVPGIGVPGIGFGAVAPGMGIGTGAEPPVWARTKTRGSSAERTPSRRTGDRGGAFEGC
jgi:hypothetical protein